MILDSDAELIDLIAELGLADQLRWSPTGMGFLVDGALYGFNTPADLLRFRALSLPDRVRTGLGALYITKLKRARSATSTACARSTGCAPCSARASSNASGIRCCAPSSATGVTTCRHTGSGTC